MSNIQDQHKTKAELLHELTELRQEVARLKAIEAVALKQAEETSKRAAELEEATIFLDSVIENLPTMLFVKDAAELRFVRWNKAGEELTGFTRAEFVGKNDYDFFPKEEADFFTAKDREVLNDGKLLDIPEEPIQTKHRGTRLLHTRKIPIYGSDGKPKYLLGISEDITERKQAEEALWENQQLLRGLVDNSAAIIYVKDLQGRYLLVNSQFETLFHFDRYEIVGKTDYEVFPKEVAEQLRANDRKVLEAGVPLQWEESAMFDDGPRTYLSIKFPFLDAAGVPYAIGSISTNITDKKRAEAVLAKRANELQTVAKVSAAISTILDVDRLLQEVVDLTKSSFGLYHAHIYLLDEANDILNLAAGADEVGRQMVAQGWSIPLEREQSLVARAARTRQGVIVNNVREAPEWLPNPLLPDTHSELAVPIMLGNRMLGVLDVQSEEIDHFTEEDVRIQTVLAAQVAVALQNARSFAEQQQSAFLLSKRVRELNCLNEVGREIAETPSVPDLLQWVTERIPAAMQYPDLCMVAIEHEGQVYGIPKAIELPCQIVHALRMGGEVIGRIYIAYAEKRDFLNEESMLLGGIASRVSSYIENRRLLEQTQNALAAQERLTVEIDSQRRTLQAVLDNIPVGVVVVEAPSRKPLLANERARQLLGRGIIHDVTKRETAEIYPAYRYGTEKLYPSKQTPLALGLLGQSASIDDMEIRHPNGARLLLQVFGAPIRDALGNIVASVAIYQDITEQKQAEQEIIQQKEFLSKIINILPVGVFAKDVQNDFRFSIWNARMEEMFGVKAEEMLGKNDYDYAEKALADSYRQADLAAIESRQVIDIPVEEITTAYGRRLAHTTKLPLYDSEGRPETLLVVLEDITERKRMEEALQASETRHRALLNAIPDLIMRLSANGTYLDVKPARDFPTLIPAEQLIGKNSFEVMPLELAQQRQRYIEQALKTGEIQVYEHQLKRSDRIAFEEIRVIPSGENEVLMIIRDITERKRAEEALRENEARLAEAMAIARLGSWEFDVATQTFTFNDQFYSLLHTTAEQEGGYLMPAMQYARKFVHPDDAYMVGAEIEQALKTTDPNYSRQLEHRIIRADGSEGYIVVRFRVVKDEHGRTVKTIGANQDITEQKRAEAELRASQERFALVVAGTQDGVWDWDIKNGTLYWSPRLKELLGYKPDELEVNFDTFTSFLHPEDAEITGAALEAHLKYGSPYDVEQRLRAKSGEYIWFRVRGQAIRDEAGNPIRMTGSSMDITAQKAAAAERERLLAEIEAAYRQYVQREWEQFLKEQHQGNWRIEHKRDVEGSISDEELAKVQAEAAREGRVKVVTGHNGHPTTPAIVAPIALRGQTIGTLSLQDIDPQRQWTAEEKALVETVSEQLALTVENLRLFDESRRAAWRDQVISESTAKVWSSSEIEEVMKAAVAQLGDKLRASEVVIRLGTEAQLTQE